MKTVRIKVHCDICRKFEAEYDLDTNEYGFFSITDAYCPVCFCALIQDIHGENIRDINNADRICKPA